MYLSHRVARRSVGESRRQWCSEQETAKGEFGRTGRIVDRALHGLSLALRVRAVLLGQVDIQPSNRRSLEELQRDSE